MPPLRIALYQGPGGVPDSTGASLAALDGAARPRAASGARLLATSEMYLTGYALGDRIAGAGRARRRSRRAARRGDRRRHGIAIVYGYPERAGTAVFNSAQLIGPDGTALANYRKTHLFGGFEREYFTPGDTAVVQADLDGTGSGC